MSFRGNKVTEESERKAVVPKSTPKGNMNICYSNIVSGRERRFLDKLGMTGFRFLLSYLFGDKG